MDFDRRWLIPAIVCVVGLFVIFVPMLFDGRELPSVSVDPIEHREVNVKFNKISKIDRAQIRAGREEVLGQVDEEGFLVDSGVRLGEPKLLADSEEASSWAILLGTYETEEEAQRYRDSLELKDVQTWVSTRKRNNSIVIDVATGPYVERATVEAQRVYLTKFLEQEVEIVVFTL